LLEIDEIIREKLLELLEITADKIKNHGMLDKIFKIDSCG
jgi:hypothetical protein